MHQKRVAWDYTNIRIADTADLRPPPAARVDRERGGVMVHPKADPAGVGGQIVDTIGHCPAQFPDQEVMHPDRLGVTLRPPFRAVALKIGGPPQRSAVASPA